MIKNSTKKLFKNFKKIETKKKYLSDSCPARDISAVDSTDNGCAAFDSSYTACPGYNDTHADYKLTV